MVCICIPSNLSFLLDPLDCNVFQEVKSGMRKIQKVINLIYSRHDGTYYLNINRLAKAPTQRTKYKGKSALERCHGFESKNTARTRILESEFILLGLRKNTWKVTKGFAIAGVWPLDRQVVFSRCNLLLNQEDEAISSDESKPLLSVSQAAERIKFVAEMENIEDETARVRLSREILEQTDFAPEKVSVYEAGRSIASLKNRNRRTMSDMDIVYAVSDILTKVTTPRKCLGLHADQQEEQQKLRLVPIEGQAPKKFPKQLSYKQNITSVGQVTSLIRANAPTDRQVLKQLQTAGGNQGDRPALASSVENDDIELDVDSIDVEAVLASVSSGCSDSSVDIDSGAGVNSRGSSASTGADLSALSSYVSASSAASLSFPVVGASSIDACISSSALAKNRGSSFKPKCLTADQKAAIETSRQQALALLQQKNHVPSHYPNTISVPRTTAQTLPTQKARIARGSLLSAAGNQRTTKVAAPVSAVSSTSSLSFTEWLCDNNVCMSLLLDPETTAVAVFSKLSQRMRLASYVIAAHIVVFRVQKHIRVYGSALKDFLNFMDPNDLDLCVPKEIPLVDVLSDLKPLLLNANLQFVSASLKGAYVLRAEFRTPSFTETISLDLVHTHHWTEQPEARVDANVNNLVVYRAEGVMARAVLEMRFPNQPACATVESIINDILRKEFIVVKRSDERFQKLIQRGYTEKETSRSKAAKARKASLPVDLLQYNVGKQTRSKRVKKLNSKYE
jgi:hypothetical protein